MTIRQHEKPVRKPASLLWVLQSTALLGILITAMAVAGCGPKSQDAAAPGSKAAVSSKSTVSSVPANAPPQAAASIQASQAMGQAMQQNATANGAAMSKATRP